MQRACVQAAARGRLRIFALSVFLSTLGWLPVCRVPARRPGDFHLRPQMKVTKAKRLNATPFGSFFALGWIGPAGHLETPPWIDATARSTRPRCASALGPAFSRGRGFAKPAPTSALQVGSVARFPSGPLDRASAACRTSERCCIEVLCFGDFHLDQQMKATRPPGRDPAGNAVSETVTEASQAVVRRATTHEGVRRAFHPSQWVHFNRTRYCVSSVATSTAISEAATITSAM